MDVLEEILKNEKKKQIPWSFRKILIGLFTHLTKIDFSKGAIAILCAYLYIHEMTSSNQNFVSHVSLNLQGESESLKSNYLQQTTTNKPDLRPFCKPENLQGELNPDFDPEKLDERFQNMSTQYRQYFENGEHNPKDCKVERLKKIAIICPLRDEKDQMRTKQFLYLLNYLIPMHRVSKTG